MSEVVRKGLPKGWQWTTMEDIADVIGGGTPKSKEKRFFDGGEVPWLTPADLSGYTAKHISRGARNITEAGLNGSSAKLMPAGTVLFTSRAPIGYVAIASNEISTNQGFKSFVLKSKNVLPDYVYWWLKGNKQLAESFASGTTFLELSGSKAKKLPIPIAPHEQQKRIVAKIEELFSHIDAGIEALKKAKRLLKQYRQSVLKAAVTGELTKEWREANKAKLEPATQLLERILKERHQKWEEQQLEQFKAKGKMPKDDKWKEKYAEPKVYENGGYEIPDAWVMARAEQVCDFITKGTTPKKDKLSAGKGEVPFIKVYNLTFDTSLNFGIEPTFTDTETHEGFLARSKVYPGDVLMNIVGPPLGKVSIVSELYDEWNINQAIAVYRPISGLNNKLLSYFLLSKPIVEWMLSKTKTTAGQVNLTLEISRDAPIPIMSVREQKEIINLIEEKLAASDRMLEELEVQLIKAEKNKQSVLASAFSGQLLVESSLVSSAATIALG